METTEAELKIKKNRQQKTTKEQQQAYLYFLLKNPGFSSGQFDPLNPNEIKEKWIELTTILNKHGPPTRNNENWKKIMTGWRNQVKSKARLLRAKQSDTEVEPPQKIAKLSNMEKHALDVWGRIVVDGDTNVSTVGVENYDIKDEIVEVNFFGDNFLLQESSSQSQTKSEINETNNKKQPDLTDLLEQLIKSQKETLEIDKRNSESLAVIAKALHGISNDVSSLTAKLNK